MAWAAFGFLALLVAVMVACLPGYARFVKAECAALDESTRRNYAYCERVRQQIIRWNAANPGRHIEVPIEVPEKYRSAPLEPAHDGDA